jgi:hypothetical protein
MIKSYKLSLLIEKKTWLVASLRKNQGKRAGCAKKEKKKHAGCEGIAFNFCSGVQY